MKTVCALLAAMALSLSCAASAETTDRQSIGSASNVGVPAGWTPPERINRMMADQWVIAEKANVLSGGTEGSAIGCVAKPPGPCIRFAVSGRGDTASVHPDGQVGYEIYNEGHKLTLYVFTPTGTLPVFRNGYWLEKGPWAVTAATHLALNANAIVREHVATFPNSGIVKELVRSEFRNALDGSH